MQCCCCVGLIKPDNLLTVKDIAHIVSISSGSALQILTQKGLGEYRAKQMKMTNSFQKEQKKSTIVEYRELNLDIKIKHQRRVNNEHCLLVVKIFIEEKWRTQIVLKAYALFITKWLPTSESWPRMSKKQWYNSFVLFSIFNWNQSLKYSNKWD